MLTAVAFLALSRPQTPVLKFTTPVVYKGVVKPGRCRIPLEVSGESHLFLVDTGIEKSYVRADVKASLLARDRKATISLGTTSLAVDTLSSPNSSVYNEIPVISGIIGMDILSKLAFSIDYDKGQVTIWPDVSSEEMEKGTFAVGEKYATIPLISEPGYLSLFLMTSLGEAELDTGAAISLLPKSATSSPEVFATSLSKPLELFDGMAGRASQAIVRNLRVGEQDIFCQQFLLSDTANVGVISAGILGKKILFDFPHKRVVFAVPSESGRACASIGALLHGTVEARKGELFLKAQLAKNLGASKNPYVRIVSLDGRTSSEWLAMFLRRDERTADLLRNAYDSLSKTGKVIVEHDGKQERLLIAPYLNP